LRRGATPTFPGDRFSRARVDNRARLSSRARRSGEAGQGLIEYGLILVIMAVVCVISLLFFGDQLSSLLSLIASAV
jgi:Flp pilus assembly pilin Flp